MKRATLILLSLMFVAFAVLPGLASNDFRKYALGVSPDPFALGLNGQYWFAENYGVQVDYMNTSLATAFITAIMHAVNPSSSTDSSLTQIGVNYRPSLGFFQTIYTLSVGQAQLLGSSIAYLSPAGALKIGDGPIALQLGVQGIVASGGVGVLPYITLYGNF